MIKGRNILTFIAVGLTLLACQWISNTFTGAVEEQRFEIPPTFDRIRIKGSFHVTLIPDSVGYAVIQCPEQVQNDISLRVKRDTLCLSENVRYRWLKDYPIIEVELHLVALPLIETYQPCKISIPVTFKSHQLYMVDWGNYVDCDARVDVDFIIIDVSGESFGRYRVSGKSEYGFLNPNGAALFDLQNTQFEYCTINQNSVSELRAWVNQHANINLLSSGNVVLSGNPTIDLNKQGSGTLIRVP